MGAFYFLCQLVSLALVQGFIGAAPSTRIQFDGLCSSCSQGRSSTLYAKSNTDECDIAVFGGGFGGLYTALAISREARMKGMSLDIAIVDPSKQFVFLPLLYDLTVGTATSAEVCPLYQDILRGTGVRHVQGKFDGFSSSSFRSAQFFSQKTNSTTDLSFRTSVVAVGSTPESSLALVPGAAECTQPFYTQENAEEMGKLLRVLDARAEMGEFPRIAIIGGGYGGVELAACMKRRLPKSQVTLLTRGPPMKGTRAEKLVDKALQRLGVQVELSSVQEVKMFEGGSENESRVVVERKPIGENERDEMYDSEPWDAVLWTAGAGPSYPVSENMTGLSKAASGRLAIDTTLRCMPDDCANGIQPLVWALGDCAEIVGENHLPVPPKTAQAAMQQADIVAHNVLAELQSKGAAKKFQFQDLGTMLTLGGPNGAVLAPGQDSSFSPIFKPLLDSARVGFGFADSVFFQLSKSPIAKKARITPIVENLESLGLSLGGYGLGVDPETSEGTLSGTLSGAARRAIYAARMPTSRQRVTAAASAAIFTAASLAKEAAMLMDNSEKKKK
eukprot:scaffold8240_cov133-Cylindrotheca_fusiformis.AAC.8